MTDHELARAVFEIARLERLEAFGRAIPRAHLKHLKRKAAALQVALAEAAQA